MPETTRISLRLSDSELAAATKLAEKLDVDRNTLIRMALQRLLVKPPGKREALTEPLPIGLAAAGSEAARDAANQRKKSS